MAVELVYLLNQNTPVIINSGFVPKGAYDNSHTYSVGDSVSYNGSSYVLYASATSGTLPTDTTKWQVVANKGDTGATGATGPAGPDTAASGYLIFGDGVTDGSWQIIQDGNNLAVQRLESSVWVEKSAFLP